MPPEQYFCSGKTFIDENGIKWVKIENPDQYEDTDTSDFIETSEFPDWQSTYELMQAIYSNNWLKMHGYSMRRKCR